MTLQLGWCAETGSGSFLAHLHAYCILGSVLLHSHCPDWRLSCWSPCSALLVPRLPFGRVLFADFVLLVKLPCQHFWLYSVCKGHLYVPLTCVCCS